MGWHHDITAASFFSGIGGIDLAFAWCGFDIRVQVEIDQYCRNVLWKNRKYWQNAKQYKDIQHVTKSEVGACVRSMIGNSIHYGLFCTGHRWYECFCAV